MVLILIKILFNFYYMDVIKLVIIENIIINIARKKYDEKILQDEELKQNIKKFCVINPDDVLNKYFDNNSNCYDIDNDNPHDVINELFDVSVKNKYNINGEPLVNNVNFAANLFSKGAEDISNIPNQQAYLKKFNADKDINSLFS